MLVGGPQSIERLGPRGALAPEIGSQPDLADQLVQRRGLCRIGDAVDVAPAHIECFTAQLPEDVLRERRLSGAAGTKDRHRLGCVEAGRVQHGREMIDLAVAVIEVLWDSVSA